MLNSNAGQGVAYNVQTLCYSSNIHIHIKKNHTQISYLTYARTIQNSTSKWNFSDGALDSPYTFNDLLLPLCASVGEGYSNGTKEYDEKH